MEVVKLAIIIIASFLLAGAILYGLAAFGDWTVRHGFDDD